MALLYSMTCSLNENTLRVETDDAVPPLPKARRLNYGPRSTHTLWMVKDEVDDCLELYQINDSIYRLVFHCVDDATEAVSCAWTCGRLN
jgi:hypothetical protein